MYSHKLIIKGLEKTDLVTRVEWFNHPSIYEYMLVETPITIADTEAWFIKNRLTTSRKDFVCSDQNSNQSLAMGGLTDISLKHSRAELYILVNPFEQGKGIGRRFIQWLCNYGFKVLNLNRIYLYSMENNQKARDLYQQLGFCYEGLLKQHVFHQGRFHDKYIYGMLRSNWDTKKEVDINSLLELNC